MNKLCFPPSHTKFVRIGALSPAACMILAGDVSARSALSLWVSAVQVQQTAFNGTIATGLALVAISVGVLMLAFGEGARNPLWLGSSLVSGLPSGALIFMSWFFPATYHDAEINHSGVSLAESPLRHLPGREETVFLCSHDGSPCFQPPQNTIRWDSHASLALCPRPVGHQQSSADVPLPFELRPYANAIRTDEACTWHDTEAHACLSRTTSPNRTTKRSPSTSGSPFSGSLMITRS